MNAKAKDAMDRQDLEQQRETSWSWLLVLGIVLTVLGHMRWGVSWCGWIAPVPFLRYLRLHRGWRSRLLLTGVILLAWTLTVAKITTAPLSPMAALVFGIPIGLLFAVGFLLWDGLRRALPDWASILLFPAVMVCIEWIQHTWTPFATWGAVAYTQIDSLVWLQSASLFGMAGLGFAMYWVAAYVEQSWSSGRLIRRHGMALLGVLAGLWLFGTWRLATSAEQKETTTKVAAVSTDATFGADKLPTTAMLQSYNSKLFQRTRRAAQMGAKAVVWNEGATMVRPHQEKAWKKQLQDLAKTAKVDLIAAYIVPLNTQPMRYENKYLWIAPDGQIRQSYLKHYPVFGEPAVAGKKPFTAHQTTIGKLSGAICYDFDYPAVGKALGRLGVGLAALPSSDWLGIHPYHTKMAAVRAIEGGFSLLRSTRMGLSAGIDAYGRIHGRQSWFAKNDRIMLVDLPTRSIKTLYNIVGDILILLGFLGLLAAAALQAQSRVLKKPQ